MSPEWLRPSRVYLPVGPWTYLLDFLCERFTHVSREEWNNRFESGLVMSSQSEKLPATAPYLAGQHILYYKQLPNEKPIKQQASILFQDEHIVVADKPHFLPVTPSGQYLKETLLYRLIEETGLAELSPIHRIDRDTAGLVVFSVQKKERGLYQALFRQRLVEKEYLAVANTASHMQWPQTLATMIEPATHFMQMQSRQCLAHEQPNAQTNITVLKSEGARSLYQLKPLTGQKHQLRVHMNELGLPIHNDGIYPTLTPEGASDENKPLQLLAHSIAFEDPVTQEARSFQSWFELELKR